MQMYSFPSSPMGMHIKAQ